MGEDSAEFDLTKQKITSWVYFTGVLGIVLFVLEVVWIDNSTGFGKSFVDAVYSFSGSHEVSFFSFPYYFEMFCLVRNLTRDVEIGDYS